MNLSSKHAKQIGKGKKTPWQTGAYKLSQLFENLIAVIRTVTWLRLFEIVDNTLQSTWKGGRDSVTK